ncbi:unnamed protein product [Callosobruchus maculatus]|uniref:Reverse transcriptase domain-containing protein n=1 Tax=Callosobruchus maculatus TaxID=64391 RepID=A0A653CC93_CALMS|nr:unnamed protein product [Callosobruchus maculatus]
MELLTTTLIAASHEELVALLNILEQHNAAYGLGINYNKTKVMIVNREHDNHREINLLCCVFLYDLETWNVKKADRARIDLTNVSILDELGNPKRLASTVSTRMLTFFGHMHRSDNMEKLVVQGNFPSGRRRGRSPTRWLDTTKQLLDMSIKSATELTVNII